MHMHMPFSVIKGSLPLCAVERLLRLKPRLLEVSDVVSVVGCMGTLQPFEPAVHSVRVIESFCWRNVSLHDRIPISS
jgi:hypothetical protein